MLLSITPYSYGNYKSQQLIHPDNYLSKLFIISFKRAFYSFSCAKSFFSSAYKLLIVFKLGIFSLCSLDQVCEVLRTTWSDNNMIITTFYGIYSEEAMSIIILQIFTFWLTGKYLQSTVTNDSEVLFASEQTIQVKFCSYSFITYMCNVDWS